MLQSEESRMEFIFWGILAFVVYMWITRKKRRDTAIQKVILQSLISERTVATNKIFWESFCGYAMDNGGGEHLSPWEKKNPYSQIAWFLYAEPVVNGQVYTIKISFLKGSVLEPNLVYVKAEILEVDEY